MIHIQIVSSNSITYLLRPQCNNITIWVDSCDYFSWRDCTLDLIITFNVKMSAFSNRVHRYNFQAAVKLQNKT